MALKIKTDTYLPVYSTTAYPEGTATVDGKVGELLIISLNKTELDTEALKTAIKNFGLITKAEITQATTSENLGVLTLTYSKTPSANIPLQYIKLGEQGTCILVGAGGGSGGETLTIKQNGETKGTYNGESPVEVDIEAPQLFVQSSTPTPTASQAIWINSTNGGIKYWGDSQWKKGAIYYAD